MPFECPKCGQNTVTYDNANESSCTKCNHKVPNAQLDTPKQIA